MQRVPLIPIGRERYDVGKARGHHSVPQAEIGELMVRMAHQGKAVVSLKGGDPGVSDAWGKSLPPWVRMLDPPTDFLST